MRIRNYKKISELNALTSASLETYVAGVDNGETVKITLDILADGVRNTINTIDVQRLNALEIATASLNAATSSYETKGNGIVSSSAQITAFGFISSSQTVDTASFVTTSSFESFSSSVHTEILAATNEQDLSYLVTTSSFNEYTASISTGSLVDRLNQIESISGSWITESETGSFLTSLNGAISSSSQLTASYDERYVLSGSITQTTWDNIGNKPNDIISSSQQITALGFVSGSYETTGRGILSGSISYNNLTDIPQNIISSSEQLPNGLISGSSQIEGFETTGRGILSGSISYNNLTDIPQNIASGSYETTGRGIISSSTQIVSELENATITNLTITNLHSVYQTSSVVYASGSNQFGDALTDSHIFSGSVIIVGSGSINGYNILTSNDTGSFETTGRGILSGSISYTDLTDIPSNIISSSEQLPNGIVSGSSQILGGSGIFSSSTQLLDLGFASGSFETTGRGILSGSISYTNLTDIPQGIVSGAGQITPLLPAGVVSGSSQLTSSYDILYINATETSSMAVSSSLYALTASFAISTSFAETSSYSVRTSQTDVYVKNVSGAQIDKGKVVRINGATGDNPLIVTASFLTEGQSANTLGITTENIANDGWGWVITEGILLGVDTNGMNAGQLLFLGQNGSFTTTPPTAPNHGVRLGEVLRQQQNNGSIYVRIDNGSELGEAHDVVDTSTTSSYGDILIKSGSVWVNDTTFSSSISTFSASFDTRINSLAISGVPAGTISGSSQLTASYDLRYTLSGSVQPLPDGLVSSSAQITAFGFISESVDLTSLNNFTASISTASLVTSINNLNTATSSYETTGRGIISESVVTISDTQPSTGIGNLWYDSNGGNLYLHYDTNTWVDTSNGVIQTILTDGSLLSTASFNSWTASFTASVPAGTISSSAQISSFGFVSGSYETTGRGIISSSTQISDLGFVTSGGNVTFNSVTANQYIVSSSVYYVTQSYSSGSTIFGNTSDDIHQFTGSVSISGSVTITGSLNIANGASLGARLWQLSDVNDNITSSTDGYLLTYNSGSNSWYSAPGAGLKGTVRLYIATNRSNASGFYFNANTRTASDSASPTADTAFMVTTNLLNRVTVYLRQDNAGPNSVLVGVAKNADGSAFSSATLITSSSLNLSANTTATYQFSGLTINTFDTLHIYCDPTNTPGTLYGIVIID